MYVIRSARDLPVPVIIVSLMTCAARILRSASTKVVSKVEEYVWLRISIHWERQIDWMVVAGISPVTVPMVTAFVVRLVCRMSIRHGLCKSVSSFRYRCSVSSYRVIRKILGK